MIFFYNEEFIVAPILTAIITSKVRQDHQGSVSVYDCKAHTNFKTSQIIVLY